MTSVSEPLTVILPAVACQAHARARPSGSEYFANFFIFVFPFIRSFFEPVICYILVTFDSEFPHRIDHKMSCSGIPWVVDDQAVQVIGESEVKIIGKGIGGLDQMTFDVG